MVPMIKHEDSCDDCWTVDKSLYCVKATPEQSNETVRNPLTLPSESAAKFKSVILQMFGSEGKNNLMKAMFVSSHVSNMEKLTRGIHHIGKKWTCHLVNPCFIYS